MEPSTRVEYRAIYRVPASILDSEEDRERGYVTRESKYGETREAVKQVTYDLRRSEESLASIIRWEQRTVTLGEWRASND